MASDFEQIKFFWVEPEFFKKSHNSVNFQKKILICCMRPYFLTSYELSIITWVKKDSFLDI